ncbi:hypothetical protein M2132_000744 [Dysgonomonas sp. PH5-45]|uniref:hypothetical protein n=1 Tax=unclassified Dysgonomonas TaxID=2630389 RepID=UPI00247367FB|nr:MULTISPECIES: hypothetical protein [unclassified Dysgonomonas]MDH6354416.1 hypothetical protein [Dysgonomonas sp. PH5-45]MDH6387315.1 hypothetical protein [Dysgonomonas sp. PH5-37]
MENLKSALADKVLEISSRGGDDMQKRLDRIQRFRDFCAACQSLMVKYPAIETELLKMVYNDDYDTKVASSRVDSIISLNEEREGFITTPPAQPLVTEHTDEEPDFEEPTESDIETETENPLPEVENEEADVAVAESVIYPTYRADDTQTEPDKEEPEVKASFFKNENLKKALQLGGIILVIVALIFIVKFVINNWVAILYVLGGAAVVFILILFLSRRKK